MYEGATPWCEQRLATRVGRYPRYRRKLCIFGIYAGYAAARQQQGCAARVRLWQLDSATTVCCNCRVLPLTPAGPGEDVVPGPARSKARPDQVASSGFASILTVPLDIILEPAPFPAVTSYAKLSLVPPTSALWMMGYGA